MRVTFPASRLFALTERGNNGYFYLRELPLRNLLLAIVENGARGLGNCPCSGGHKMIGIFLIRFEIERRESDTITMNASRRMHGNLNSSKCASEMRPSEMRAFISNCPPGTHASYALVTREGAHNGVITTNRRISFRACFAVIILETHKTNVRGEKKKRDIRSISFCCSFL